mmetsp:Transcript_14217/g.30871  ORF Transcript_14217/g.30871 Transcript_14217/m.30871 type:complete len:222 (+) Transcript_14217:78-743(+)
MSPASSPGASSPKSGSSRSATAAAASASTLALAAASAAALASASASALAFAAASLAASALAAASASAAALSAALACSAAAAASAAPSSPSSAVSASCGAASGSSSAGAASSSPASCSSRIFWMRSSSRRSTAVAYNRAGGRPFLLALPRASAWPARSKSGKRLGYWVGSARDSAAFLLTFWRSARHASTTRETRLGQKARAMKAASGERPVSRRRSTHCSG